MAARPGVRAPVPSKKASMMRPPTGRPGPNRAQTATPTLMGRTSPADDAKIRSPKRRLPVELEQEAGEETNINVVVRCRGRSDREVRENSGVVVSTEGTKGKKVELSMGPNAVSNKTYGFDKVFSPAADQGIIFDEVVSPVLDEVLNGFNCTIFAYGQTGTGKTYTMSGDITDMLPIPDEAGIIPRVLHTLFDRLGDGDTGRTESSVKCSFIELYNEELRDLLALEEGAKLKIFDEANKNGRTTTLVQGMEETHIKSASKGIQLLREGSHKRQVAATKCNDLSSRSHTVFTVTIYMKRTSEAGEDFVSSGKLNLVDLAGSENIQRSGAENKRATEAGLINKSLLTLGRVINALVDKSSHIPYRESKLTRLLQDSLGGRTKTCIIATLSPAKSNLEETISTLDYAFRAKNIRNKPQINQMVSKKTLLKEFTSEIEKLKSELIATRQRNGVYLTAETWEELTTESESRRILSEEQRDKIETMEANLRNKGQELFLLTTNFQSLKSDNEQTRASLDDTQNVLDRTEIVLAHTRRNLAEEAHLRKAHEDTEQRLALLGEDLIGTLGTTTDHVNKLHSKLRRRSDLQTLNRTKWTGSQDHVVRVTDLVEARIDAIRHQQEDTIATMRSRVRIFVDDELRELETSQASLREKAHGLEQSESEVSLQAGKAKDEMNDVLEGIRTLRQDVKQKVGAGLSDLSAASHRIGEGITSELDSFHTQLRNSYVSLGRDFKSIFEDMIRRMNEQKAEAERLRRQIAAANSVFAKASDDAQAQLAQAVKEERTTAAAERAALLTRVSDLINETSIAQETRLTHRVESASKRIKTSEVEYRTAQQTYDREMDAWQVGTQALIDSSVKSRDTIKNKLKADWTSANEQTTRLTETTQAVHGETVQIVNRQMAEMDGQLVALDGIFDRVRSQNEEHHEIHNASLRKLTENVQASYRSIGAHFETSYSHTKDLEIQMGECTSRLSQTVNSLSSEGDIRHPLRHLHDEISASQIAEYMATGETPAKVAFAFPTNLPRTEDHETLLDRMRGGASSSPRKSPGKRSPSKTIPRSSPSKTASSPSKTPVFTDLPPPTRNITAPAPTTRPGTSVSSQSNSLRELDVNVGIAAPTQMDLVNVTVVGKMQPVLKRHHTNPLSQSHGVESGLPPPIKQLVKSRKTVAGIAEGRENVTPVPARSNLSASIGPGGGEGRRLRSRGSD